MMARDHNHHRTTSSTSNGGLLNTLMCCFRPRNSQRSVALQSQDNEDFYSPKVRVQFKQYNITHTSGTFTQNIQNLKFSHSHIHSTVSQFTNQAKQLARFPLFLTHLTHCANLVCFV